MKYVKMLGLAAAVAAALMAFAGAGTASATILTSPANVQVPKGTEIVASIEKGTSSVLKAFKEVTCTEGTIKFEVEKPGAATETVSGPVKSEVYANCNCEVVTVNAGGTLEIHSAAALGNGTLTSKNTTITTTCAGTTCRYVTLPGGTHIGTLTGSINLKNSTATIDVVATLEKEEVSSFLCPLHPTWEAKYLVTSPDYLDVD